MAIYQRRKSWYYDFVHKGQRYTGCFGPVSRTIAKEELARKKAEVIEGRLNPNKIKKSPRFDVFVGEYLEWSKTNKKPASYQRNVRALKRLTATFGTKKLSELTPWHIEQYKKARKETGVAPGTVNLEVKTLKGMLNKARTWRKLAENPGKEVKLLKEVKEKIRFLSEEEEVQILSACSHSLRRLVSVGLLTGFRRQELITLRPEDVDLNRDLVSVAACYSKNGESRTLPLSPRLKVFLEKALESNGNAPTVFVTEYGNPWSADGIRTSFRRACKRAGVEGVSLHVLRHTFASRLVMAGVDIRTVQELMGHKTIAMTLRYAHLSPDHKRKAMEALESHFSADGRPAESPVNFHNTPTSSPSREQVKLIAVR